MYTDLAPTRLSEKAYDAIRGMIAEGQLRRGELLSEVQLAQSLKISRTPVREAVKRLIAENLLEATTRGVRVFRPTVDDLADVYFIRASLEGAVARAAALNLTITDIKDLRRIHDAGLKAIAAKDVAAIVEFNGAFHWRIISAAGNRYAEDLLSKLDPVIASYRRMSLGIPEHQRSSSEDHARLIDLLERRDGTAAEALLRRHIVRAGNRIVETALRLESDQMGGGLPKLKNLRSLAPDLPDEGAQ